MRLFGTFKSIEVYLILTAIFLLYTFDQLCENRENNMMVRSYFNKFNAHFFKRSDTVAGFCNSDL